MAFTTSDLAAIDAAIASGELSIRGADGKTVTYRDTDDLLKARAVILADMAAAAKPRPYPRHQLADFSD
jgi:roadblock/LC7 domain-containing protein